MEPVMIVFEELAIEARHSHDKGCGERARALADACDSYGLEYEIMYIFIRDSNIPLRPVNPQTEWDFHYAIRIQDTVFDPSYGIPIPSRNYFRKAFQNPRSEFDFFIMRDKDSIF